VAQETSHLRDEQTFSRAKRLAQPLRESLKTGTVLFGEPETHLPVEKVWWAGKDLFDG